MKDLKKYLFETLLHLTILFGIYKVPSNLFLQTNNSLSKVQQHIFENRSQPLLITESANFLDELNPNSNLHPHFSLKLIDSYVNEFKHFQRETFLNEKPRERDEEFLSSSFEPQNIPEYYLYPVQIQSYINNRRADTSVLQQRDINVNDFINDANLNKVLHTKL